MSYGGLVRHGHLVLHEGDLVLHEETLALQVLLLLGLRHEEGRLAARSANGVSKVV